MKIEDYEKSLLEEHMKAIAKENGCELKFMKGFMDVEYDPVVVSYDGEYNCSFHPCGNKYIMLHYSQLQEIEDWMDEIDDEFNAFYDAEFKNELEESDDA